MADEAKKSNSNAKGGKLLLYDVFVCSLSFVFLVIAVLISVSLYPGGKKKEVKKETGLGLSNKKDDNFGEWYSEVSIHV
uniref:Uncharacterized protein n=1 Tax=Nelumbo nucifera TaxID=4432 RepID=A0A822XZC0_NELNU|nr:TPA_asm: hypothetical protein HUJ06_026537 [Nelumbo nucifera]